MLHYIELNSKQWPLLFGNYAFRKLKERGITLQNVISTLSESDPTILADVLFCGIMAGQVKTANGQPFEKIPDADTVALWMDERPGIVAEIIPLLLSAIQDITGVKPEPEEAETDAKKKK